MFSGIKKSNRKSIAEGGWYKGFLRREQKIGEGTFASSCHSTVNRTSLG